MRTFADGSTITIEPWRAKAFPVIKDLIVSRDALDHVIQAGGYISVNTGGVPDANAILISKKDADISMDAAECIGCGACVAACPNGSAMLFTAATITRFAVLPQGRIEAKKRVCLMTEAMMRSVVGDHSVDEVLTTGREQVEQLAREKLIALSEQYDTGLSIELVNLKTVNVPPSVQPALREVEEAKQERERMINEAWTEYNKVIPRAKGEAEKQVSEAEGYKLKRVNESQGDAAAFDAVLVEYLKAPEVTRRRLYLETMTQVLPGLSSTWIVDDSVTQLLPMVQGKGLGGGK